jgi:hypothetical protein
MAVLSPSIDHLLPPIDHALSEDLGLFAATGAGMRGHSGHARHKRNATRVGATVGIDAEYLCELPLAQDDACNNNCAYNNGCRRLLRTDL